MQDNEEILVEGVTCFTAPPPGSPNDMNKQTRTPLRKMDTIHTEYRPSGFPLMVG